MTLAIGLCFGKMSSLHEGLGEYGLLFGEHLARRAPALLDQHGVELFYRLPERLHGRFGTDVRYLQQRSLQRHPSLHLRRFDLWHVLHQHNPYRPPLLARRVVATVADLNHLYDSDTRFAHKSKRRLDRIHRYADSFITISEFVRGDLIKAYGNAKFPPPVKFTIDYDPQHQWQRDDHFGASLASFAELFTAHGYRLVCCNSGTGSNAFFVSAEHAARFADVPTEIERLYVGPRYWLPKKAGHPASLRTIEKILSGR